MTDYTQKKSFLERAKSIVLDHVSDEHFGVSELADAMNMSRSNLLRKIKKQTNLSASLFIREIRLKKAAEFLKETELTASEISYEVGFSNPSYFTKCYREYFGYPPGETKNQIEKEVEQQKIKKEEEEKLNQNKSRRNSIIVGVSIIIVFAIVYFFRDQLTNTSRHIYHEKSLAVLPFKNLSEDNSNLYFINGIMEASLNNLQRIKDLRVVSRTSTEKYRNNPKTVAEIAKELNVNYLIEGSGQKIGNNVLIRIQLIDVKNDSPIWSEQYQYQLENVFELQNTIAKKVAFAIEANVTPTEFAIIDKKPTDNVVAYDLYLKGLEYQQQKNEESLIKAIDYFKNAVKEDSEFAIAYAQLAICYYYLDSNKVEKQYLEKLNKNADKALLYDSSSELSLIAKALYFININQFHDAISHLEKALEYNPNSSAAVLMLSDLYARVVPNTSKYLTYALRGVRLAIEANDSVSKSYIYLHLSNALVQNGFAKASLKYIDKSLKQNPNNPFAPYLKHFIDYANNEDLNALTKGIYHEWKKDTTRADITQELAKMYYFKEDYESALMYYEKYLAILSNQKIDLYPAENIKIAFVYDKMGNKEKANEYLNKYKEFVKKDKSIYKEASLASLYLYENKLDKAIQAYQSFSGEESFQYWMILFLKKDPLLQRLKNHSKFDKTMLKIESKFWKNHTKLSMALEEENLL